ncbi:MAG: hypothetical protein ACD_61C00267G0002 [uncultured bacterium]|nr:MAG: hypothetical protein ACD_61C00267G0002 [uncultured bacterium]
MNNISPRALKTLDEIRQAGGEMPMAPQEVRQPDVQELIRNGRIEVKEGLPYVLVLK